MFNGRRCHVVVYPSALYATQVLITDDFGEIQSVCYVNPDGFVYWKLNKPSQDRVGKIEKEIKRILEERRDEL
jgi:hypothetical protein